MVCIKVRNGCVFPSFSPLSLFLSLPFSFVSVQEYGGNFSYWTDSRRPPWFRKGIPFFFFSFKGIVSFLQFQREQFHIFTQKKTSIGCSTGDICCGILALLKPSHPLPGSVTSHRGGIDMTANSTNVPLIIQEKAVDLPRSVLLRCSLPRNTGEKGSLGRCNMALSRLARLINSFFSVLLLLTQAL